MVSFERPTKLVTDRAGHARLQRSFSLTEASYPYYFDEPDNRLWGIEVTGTDGSGQLYRVYYDTCLPSFVFLEARCRRFSAQARQPFTFSAISIPHLGAVAEEINLHVESVRRRWGDWELTRIGSIYLR